MTEQQRIYLALAGLQALKLIQAEPTLQRALKNSPFAVTAMELSILLDIDLDVVDAAIENLEEIGLVA